MQNQTDSLDLRPLPSPRPHGMHDIKTKRWGVLGRGWVGEFKATKCRRPINKQLSNRNFISQLVCLTAMTYSNRGWSPLSCTSGSCQYAFWKVDGTRFSPGKSNTAGTSHSCWSLAMLHLSVLWEHLMWGPDILYRYFLRRLPNEFHRTAPLEKLNLTADSKFPRIFWYLIVHSRIYNCYRSMSWAKWPMTSLYIFTIQWKH
jgi:hypothetical protein